MPIVNFCKKHKIPFTDQEKLLFEIGITKKNFGLYKSCLQKCFNSSLPDELELTRKKFEQVDKYIASLENESKQQD